MSSAQLYRQSKLGDCLVEALDDLINAGKLNPDLAIRVLSEYDVVRGNFSPGPPEPCQAFTCTCMCRTASCQCTASVKLAKQLNIRHGPSSTIFSYVMLIRGASADAQAMNEALEKKVAARASFKGHLDTYRFCDNVRSPM